MCWHETFGLVIVGLAEHRLDITAVVTVMLLCWREPGEKIK
jgi:hypothetical protein